MLITAHTRSFAEQAALICDHTLLIVSHPRPAPPYALAHAPGCQLPLA